MDEYIRREGAIKKIKSCIFAADDAWESGYNTAMAEIMEWIKHMPAADVQPVTWYTADENQPDSVGDDVLIVDHDGKYHVAYYCSKGNWIDTNTGNPIDVIKWRYLDGDDDGKD